MNNKLFSLLTTAIVTGLLASQVAKSEETSTVKGSEDQMSTGKNSCKGMKVEDKNSCKAIKNKKQKKLDKNSCKNGCGEAKNKMEENKKD